MHLIYDVSLYKVLLKLDIFVLSPFYGHQIFKILPRCILLLSQANNLKIYGNYLLKLRFQIDISLNIIYQLYLEDLRLVSFTNIYIFIMMLLLGVAIYHIHYLTCKCISLQNLLSDNIFLDIPNFYLLDI